MSNGREFDYPSRYTIKVKGHLGDNWSEWFDGLEITQEKDGNSLLTGVVADQTALYGLLIKMRDINLILISVARDEMVKDLAK